MSSAPPGPELSVQMLRFIAAIVEFDPPVVRVRDTYTFGPDHDTDRTPRWELVAAIVYGDASASKRAKVKALYERGGGGKS